MQYGHEKSAALQVKENSDLSPWEYIFIYKHKM